MADKLGILINTILNVKQEDLQKQLDSVAKKIKINLKPRIDFDENVIAKFKSDVDKLAKNIKLNLRFDVDKQSVKDAEKTVAETAKKISEKSKSQNKIKVFDIEQLEAEGKQFFISATGIVNRVKNQFKDLGDVNVNFLKNAKNQIVGFEAEIKKLDGTIEQLRFDMAKIKVGDSTQKGFVFSGANLIDKNAGDVLQKNLNTLQKFETRLKNIRDSFTSSRGVKDVTNLNILNKEYNSILSTIEKLRKSQSNLTEEQKRNIDKQINTLRSLYKAYRDIEITAEKGFNFKQYQEVSDGFNKIKTTQDGFNISLLQNHKLVKASVQETEQYLKINQELQKGNWIKDVGVYVDKATGKMYQFQNAQRNIMVDTLTWSKAITTALKRIAQWAVSGTLIFGTLRQIKESIAYIKDVDTELTNLSKVVDLTTSQMIEMKNAAIEMSKALGQSSVEVLKGFAEFGRYTKDLSEIQELTRTAIMASNVTDLSVTEASKSLISALTQFKLSAKDSINVLDQWNEIQNNFKVTAEDMAEGISKVGSIAYQAKVPIQDLNGYITALVQSMQISGDEAGTALKSMISRIYRIGEEGAEDAGKTEEFLNKLGIAVRKSKDEFLPFNEILLQIKNRWSELTQAEKIALEQQVGGTWHYAKVAALIENMNVAIDASTKAYNSQGSAIKENQKYLDSIAGRYQIFRDTLESIYNSFWSSDLFKNVLSGATEFLNIIDRVIKQLGGLKTVLLLVATIGISKFLTSMFAIAKGAGVLETALVAVQLGIKGISTALLGLLTNPVTWLIAAIGAITVGIMAWANHQQKLKEQIEATTKAQSDFNKIINEFNKTLDVQKINEAAQALEQLKQATNYDESVKQIQKLKEEITRLEATNVTRSARGYTYGVNDGAIAIKKKKLAELEERIKSVTEAEKKYNEAQKIGNALDYESVNAQTKKIAATLREISENEKLFGSYKEVNGEKKRIPGLYDEIIRKLKAGEKLTEEEIALNNKLLDQYPEYTRLINEKTGALGVSLEALDANTQAQKALATVELTTLKETARARRIETDNIIKDTERQIESYEARIKAIEAADLALQKSDPEEYARRVGGHSLYKSMLSEYMNEARKKLANAKLAESAWNTLENLNIDDLKKSSSSSNRYFSSTKDSSKSSSSKSTPFSEQFDFIDTKIKSLNQELKELQQQLDDTFSPADKQTIIDKMIVAQQKKADLLKKAIKTYEDSAQKELQKIPESLRSAVVSGSFNIATISEKTYGEEHAKEISEAIKQYQSLTDTIIGLKNEYAEIDNTIRSLDLDKITLSFEEFDDKIKESDQALEELDYQLNLLGENDFDRKAELIGKKIEVTTSQVNEYAEELERLKAIVPANAEEAEKLKERIDELTKKFREGKVSIKEYKDTFEETAKSLVSTLLNTQKDIDKKNLDNQLKEREKQIYDITEAEFEAYKKAKIESLKKQKEENEKIATDEAKEMARLLGEKIKEEEKINYSDIVDFSEIYEDIHNQKIKEYQEIIDMLERTNELEQQRIEREERLLEIQELQIKLQNTLNNKNVQILRKKEDGTWDYEYVADPEKVEEIQKQLTEKQKDFNEWEKNNSLKQIKELLQHKIEQEQESIKISNETYEKIAKIETEKFNSHYENMDILAQNALEDLKTTYSNKWDEIIKVLQEKVRIAEQEYAKLFGASITGTTIQYTQTPSTGFGTTSSAESEAYKKQLKEAIGGDREAYRQAEIARANQVIANRKAQGLDTSAQETYLKTLLDNTFKFKEGGIVDYTGLAWVDGSKSKPEVFLDSTDTKLFSKFVDFLPNMTNILNNWLIPKMNVPSLSKVSTSSEVKQIFNISKLEFPNVKSADDIKEAILDLPRLSLQMAKAQ